MPLSTSKQYISIIRLATSTPQEKNYDEVTRVIIDCDEYSTFWQNNFDFLCIIKTIAKENTTNIICDILNHLPVSSEISDFTPCMHEQGNIVHTKYTDKTDH